MAAAYQEEHGHLQRQRNTQVLLAHAHHACRDIQALGVTDPPSRYCRRTAAPVQGQLPECHLKRLGPLTVSKILNFHQSTHPTSAATVGRRGVACAPAFAPMIRQA